MSVPRETRNVCSECMYIRSFRVIGFISCCIGEPIFGAGTCLNLLATLDSSSALSKIEYAGAGGGGVTGAPGTECFVRSRLGTPGRGQEHRFGVRVALVDDARHREA